MLGDIESYGNVNESSELITTLKQNAKYFRKQMEDAGFDIVKGNTAIVPVMLYDEVTALKMADMLLKRVFM